MGKYVIGIDFGTTNCTLAYAELKNSSLEQFTIPQIIAAGTLGEQASFPSFLYFPLPEELNAGIVSMEGMPASGVCSGTFARDRGAEMPDRVVASAKSWLCHAGIDRRAPLLPLGNDSTIDKISPLSACASLLEHLREAWNFKMPQDPFDQQQILITVPASFDPSARQLVQEAAEMAEYPEVLLLEEPQAAFYSWLHAHAEDWRKRLKVGDCILVADIGGGTTDFSLISVRDEEGNLTLERLAVGAHLLLGGDNIDLALAYLMRDKFEVQGHSLSDWQMQSLVHACRRAKELLLGDAAPESMEITIQGRGSKLIGGALSMPLTQQEVQQLVVEGFIPLVSPEERSPTERRIGIQELGLPFAQDARISCQLAKFLSMTGEAETTAMDRFIMPTAVLFNGGTLKSSALRERLVALLNQWAQSLDKPPVRVLEDADYDFAVSRGAAYYALARQGKGVRIKSGTSRSYFVGVEESAPAIPGFPPRLTAVCVAPFGMEEGSQQVLDSQQFSLIVGELATFRFFSCGTPLLSNGVEPQVGMQVKNWKQELAELHPIETLLERGTEDGKAIRVTLKSRVTELGVLELWCEAADGRQWKLEFDIRDRELEGQGQVS